jgi:exonuclease III
VEPQGEPIRLMTWNLEDFPKSVQTLAEVVEVLGEQRPDLVAVQEITEGSGWQTLDDTLPEYAGLLASEGDGFTRVGLLYRPDRVALGNVKTLFSSDSWAFPRPVLSMSVKDAAHPEHGFTLAIVHLKASLDEESLSRRRSACAKLDAWIRDEQAAGHEDEYVIVGDYNDQLLDPPEWNAYGPLLTAQDGGFLTMPLEAAGEFTYIPFESFLDHAHVRGPSLFALSSAEVLHLDRMQADYEQAVSDHRPVMVTLRWSE